MNTQERREVREALFERIPARDLAHKAVRGVLDLDALRAEGIEVAR